MTLTEPWFDSPGEPPKAPAKPAAGPAAAPAASPAGPTRSFGRSAEGLRPVKITRNVVSSAAGSVLIEMGLTRVLCTATVEHAVPKWLESTGKGWVTAEYAMLPAAGGQRKPRERFGRVDSRSLEIQRLIGRSLRAVVDMDRLDERTIWIDCDVIEADGGTRTAAVTGAYVALADCVRWLLKEKIADRNPLTGQVAAVSVGIVRGQCLLDLDYREDSGAEVDLNLVMTDKGELVEVQGSAEKKPFTEATLQQMLGAGRKGIEQLLQMQKDLTSGAV